MHLASYIIIQSETEKKLYTFKIVNYLKIEKIYSSSSSFTCNYAH